MSDSLKALMLKAELSEAAVAGLNAAMAELDKVKGDLGERYDTIVQAISQALDAPAPAAAAPDEAMQAAAEAALADLDQEEPAVANAAQALALALGKTRKVKHADDLPPHLKAELDASRLKAEQQDVKIAKMEHEGEVTKTEIKVKADLPNVPMDPKELAEMLVTMDPEHRKAVETMLGKVSGLVGKALNGEIGTGGADDGASAANKIKKHAAEIKKTALEGGKRLTDAAARVQARKAHPVLAREEREDNKR